MSAAAEVEGGGSVIVVEKMPLWGQYPPKPVPLTQPIRKSSGSRKCPTMLTVIKDLIALEPVDEYMARWQDEIRADIEKYEAEGATYLYDSPALHKLQTYVGGDYVGNPKLIDVYGDKALESLQWLSELGVNWKEDITSAVGTHGMEHTPTDDWGSNGSSFVLPQKKFISGGDLVGT